MSWLPTSDPILGDVKSCNALDLVIESLECADGEFCDFAPNAMCGAADQTGNCATIPDGCTKEYVAPEVIAIEPGHDGWVVGDESAIVIELDFEGDTARQFGIPETHHH